MGWDGARGKGGFGSGAAFAAASILALVLEPGQALGIMLPLLMLIDVSTLRPYWGRWSMPDARLLIAGAVPGVVLGAWLYQIADADVGLPIWAGGLAGAVAGFTSFVSHAGGPPAAVWLLSRGLDKTTFQATTVILFWIINIVKFVPYAFLGIFTAQTLLVDLILAPFAVLGAWLGVRAHRIVPERAFFALTYVLLTVTGTKLIWDGLT